MYLVGAKKVCYSRTELQGMGTLTETMHDASIHSFIQWQTERKHIRISRVR